MSAQRRAALPSLLAPLLASVALLVGACAQAPVQTPGMCPRPTRGRLPTPLWTGCDQRQPQRQLHDMADSPGALARPRPEVLTAVARACAHGLEIRVLVVPSGPDFSLVDFTEQAFRCGGGGPARAVLAATRSGTLHARVPWWSHRHARATARSLLQRDGGDVERALAGLAETLAAEQRRRRSQRWVLQGVSVAAAASLLLLLARALKRGRTQGDPGPPPGPPPTVPVRMASREPGRLPLAGPSC